MVRVISCSSSSLSSLLQFPPKPKPHILKPEANHCQENERRLLLQMPLKISRRDAALLSFFSLLPSFAQPDSAIAFSFGISGPKDWLKEQKKRASKFLLAPIDASRESLRSAYLLLMDRDSTDKDFEEVQRLLRSAARDCVPVERSSLVAFQAKTGVEVCTFKLVMKNASSLLDDRDPVKLAAEAVLNDLIRSFTSLTGLASDTGIQLVAKREKVAVALMDTLSSLDKFEKGVKNCLEI